MLKQYVIEPSSLACVPRSDYVTAGATGSLTPIRLSRTQRCPLQAPSPTYYAGGEPPTVSNTAKTVLPMGAMGSQTSVRGMAIWFDLLVYLMQPDEVRTAKCLPGSDRYSVSILCSSHLMTLVLVLPSAFCLLTRFNHLCATGFPSGHPEPLVLHPPRDEAAKITSRLPCIYISTVAINYRS